MCLVWVINGKSFVSGTKCASIHIICENIFYILKYELRTLKIKKTFLRKKIRFVSYDRKNYLYILLRIYDGSYNLIRITYIMHIYTLYQNRSISDHIYDIYIYCYLLYRRHTNILVCTLHFHD